MYQQVNIQIYHSFPSSSKIYKLHLIDKITETDYSSNDQFIEKTTNFEYYKIWNRILDI